MSITGELLIGRQAIQSTGPTLHGVDAASGAALEPAFATALDSHVEQACSLAAAAFDSYRATTLEARAAFLEAIADEIVALGASLVERAAQESGLPLARIQGERDRTANQLRLFAREVHAGRWLGVRVDPALPQRQPLPRPDLRQQRIPLGPVAVFGASNFPLAFSVAGGDTASALAAGCPVVVKGHPAHPGTSALVGDAIRAAVAECGLPEGVFSLLQGPSNALGAALVANPHIKAVGFTGSRAGGLALVEIAAKRAEPIPVYAEMSSVNPVILFPAALAARAEAIGKSYVGSVTMGSGQFCTNPGIVLALDGPDLDRFVAAAAEALGEQPPQVMLTSGIHGAFEKGVAAIAQHDRVEIVARGSEPTGCNRGRPALFQTDAAAFLAHPELAHEVFGATSIIIRAQSFDEIRQVIAAMEGQLTATLQLDDADADAARPFIPLLERKAGRILANGWPTGVEVCYAMVHGGPYPATSDPRTTSVGAAAIERFLRPVCYQDLPDSLLPAPVRHGNPLGLPRLVDGTVVG